MNIALIVAAVVVVVIVWSCSAIKIVREYERASSSGSAGCSSTEGAGHLHPHPDRRQDGQGRPAHGHAERAAAGRHHPRQRAGARERRRVLPHRRAEGAVVQVENYMRATSQISQTTLRSVLGQHELDELLAEREKINAILQRIIDEQTSPWGIKVSVVEVKDVEIPPTCSARWRARPRPTRAAREGDRRRGRVPGLGAAQGRGDGDRAAPIALQLRYLQTLIEISSSDSTTIVFPAPVDILARLLPQSALEHATRRLLLRRSPPRASRGRAVRPAARGSAGPRRWRRRGSGPCPCPA